MDSAKEEKNFILVDTSYWIFYRYYAILQWWKHAKPEQPLPENPYESAEFVEKFTKTFTESIGTFKKKLKIHKKSWKVIAARDCHRKDIWRNHIYPQYKESRDKDDAFMGGDFFKHIYQNGVLEQAGIDHIMQFPTMEGDDVVAIMKRFIREKYPEANIIIIANDHDYLQLLDDKTNIVNFQMKNLRESKKVFPEAEKNLFYKIVLGDKSDCIPPIFKKCGPKTVQKYYENPEEFEKALTKEDAHNTLYRNTQLVSFQEIPSSLIQNFAKEYRSIIDEL